MPELVISEDAPVAMVEAYITALIHFHDRDEMFGPSFTRNFILLSGGLAASPDDKPFSMPAWMVKSLIVGPSATELEAAAYESKRAGFTAGHMLATLQIAHTLGKPLSLSRAHRVIEQAQQKKEDHVLGVKMIPDWANALEAWTRMASVAHLWAGYALVASSRVALAPAERVQQILSLAGAFERWGIVAPAYRKKPVLDAQTIWSVPARFLRAGSLAPRPIDSLPSWLVNAIKDYRHED